MIRLLSLILLAGFVSAHDVDPDRGIVNPRSSSPLLILTLGAGCSRQDVPPGLMLTMNSAVETLSNIISRYPGKICRAPVDLEARTLSGLTPHEAGDEIYGNDVSVGLICKNADQTEGSCSNYRVRFSCYAPYCSHTCWIEWFNSDDHSGTGDWELLCDLQSENPGKICERPLYIEAITIDTLTSAASTGEVFDVPTGGFHCDNDRQVDGQCRDYRVCFACPCVYGSRGSVTESDLDGNGQICKCKY